MFFRSDRFVAQIFIQAERLGAGRFHGAGGFREVAAGDEGGFSFKGELIENIGHDIFLNVDNLNQFNQFISMLDVKKHVGAFEAKTHLSQLLDEVEAGEKIVITRHGKPVAELVPTVGKKRARFGCAKGEGFYMAPDFDAPLEEFKDYM